MGATRPLFLGLPVMVLSVLSDREQKKKGSKGVRLDYGLPSSGNLKFFVYRSPRWEHL
jgi:hypothetical protein